VLTVVVFDIRFLVRMLGQFCLLLMRPLLWAFEGVFERIRRTYPLVLELALDHKPLVVAAMLLARPAPARGSSKSS